MLMVSFQLTDNSSAPIWGRLLCRVAPNPTFIFTLPVLWLGVHGFNGTQLINKSAEGYAVDITHQIMCMRDLD